MKEAGIRIEITPFVENNTSRMYETANRRTYEMVRYSGARTFSKDDIKRLLQIITETLEEMCDLNLIVEKEKLENGYYPY